MTEWDAEGVLYGDADNMVEQAQRFAEAGVSELSVAIHSVDELVWFDENVIAHFAEAM